MTVVNSQTGPESGTNAYERLPGLSILRRLSRVRGQRKIRGVRHTSGTEMVGTLSHNWCGVLLLLTLTDETFFPLPFRCITSTRGGLGRNTCPEAAASILPAKHAVFVIPHGSDTSLGAQRRIVVTTFTHDLNKVAWSYLSRFGAHS